MITTIWCTTLHLCNFMLFRRAQLGFYLLSFISWCWVFLRQSNLHQTWARRPDIKLEKTKHDQHKFISRTSIKVHRRADNHIETFPVCCFCKNWFKHGGINIETFLVCCFSRKKTNSSMVALRLKQSGSSLQQLWQDGTDVLPPVSQPDKLYL